MTDILKKLFKAADDHAEYSGEPDHAVGDLQDLLREAWGLMTVSQRIAFLESDAVDNNLETGALDEFTADDLIDSIRKELTAAEELVASAGYCIVECEDGFFWQTEEFEGLTLVSRDDVVVDALQHMRQAP